MKRRTLIIIAVVVLLAAGVGAYLFLGSGNNGTKAQPQGGGTVTVWTANENIPLGTTSDKLAGLTSSKQVPAASAQQGAVADLKQVEGKQTTVSITAGQQLTLAMFATADQAAANGAIKLPSGTVEIAVQLNALQTVGGQLKAGNKVSVFVTATVGKGSSGDGKEATRRVASSVMITKVVSGGTATTTTTQPGAQPSGQASAQPSAQPSGGATTAPGKPTGASGSGSGMMLLLAVTPNDAARLIMASKSGTITLARENDSSSVNAGQSATVTVDKVLG